MRSTMLLLACVACGVIATRGVLAASDIPSPGQQGQGIEPQKSEPARLPRGNGRVLRSGDDDHDEHNVTEHLDTDHHEDHEDAEHHDHEDEEEHDGSGDHHDEDHGEDHHDDHENEDHGDHHDEDEHGHGAGNDTGGHTYAGGSSGFEYAGLYPTPEALYALVAKKMDHEDHGDGEADADADADEGGDAHAGHSGHRRARQVEEEHELTYVTATMKIVVLPVADGSEATLRAAVSEGEHALEEDCVPVSSGGMLTAVEDVCYEVTFIAALWQTTFAINASAAGFVAVFTEHAFAEVAGEVRDDHGDIVVALHTIPENNHTDDAEQSNAAGSDESDDDGNEKHWGEAMAACCVVWICTLVGLLLLIPLIGNARTAYKQEFDAISSAFGAGSILACAVFLMLLESSHYIALNNYDREVDVTWRWGVMVLSGIVAGWVIDLVVFVIAGEDIHSPAVHTAAQPGAPLDVVPSDGEASTGNVVVVASRTTEYLEVLGHHTGVSVVDSLDATAIDKADHQDVAAVVKAGRSRGLERPAGATRILTGVLVSDFLHNFSDGIFIGAAFESCGAAFGWTVAAATCYHEIAQELTDFVLLTDRAGLSTVQALGLNFAAGFSVVIGAIVVLAADIDKGDIGLILAFGGGVYIEIGATECLGRVLNAQLGLRVRLVTFCAFICGAAAIGLVLLDHNHCDASAGGSATNGTELTELTSTAAAHAGHNH